MRVLRYAPAVVLATVIAGVAAAPTLAQSKKQLDALGKQVQELLAAGKDAEAMSIAKRYVAAARKRHGEGHPAFATALHLLGLTHKTQRHFAKAEALYQRSLKIREKAFGPHHPDVGLSLSSLGLLYLEQGRYIESEPLFKRDLAITEKTAGRNHPDLGPTLYYLAVLYRAQGRTADAEPLYRRAITILEGALGAEDPSVSAVLGGLAELHLQQGRYAEAESLGKRVLEIVEKMRGSNHPEMFKPLNDLARVHQAQGRYSEAESLTRRALAIGEKSLGAEHPNVLRTLNGLAELYREQDRHSEAEMLYKSTWTIREKTLGLDHPDVGQSLNNLALLYTVQGRFDEAEPLAKRALAIAEKALDSDHLATALLTLAELHREQGRYAEAEPLNERALSIREKALGLDHPDVGLSLNNLAVLYLAQGRAADAERLHARALAIAENTLGPDHRRVGTTLSNLAAIHFEQADWPNAVDFFQRGTNVTLRRMKRSRETVDQALTGKALSESVREGLAFAMLVKASHRLAAEAPTRALALAEAMFLTAQWGQGSEAAAALAQMAARQTKNDSALAGLVRERQDLVGEWQARDKLLISAVSQPRDKRSSPALEEQRTRSAAIDRRIADIDRSLKDKFPEYAALASPEPLSISEVQGQLRADEAVILFLDTPEWKPTPEETFLWVVTKTDARWARIELGTKALTARVQALRCGLDYLGAWTGARCFDLLGINYTAAHYRSGEPLPFDLVRAHELYKTLFGQVEDLIKNKHLLIVPSGPLTQLPFQVLVTQPVTASAACWASPATSEGSTQPTDQPPCDPKVIAWLPRRHALTVLPAVSSLKALRQHAKTSRATKPLIGFGNPLLDGPDARYAKQAEAARDKQHCPKTVMQRVAGLSGEPRGVTPLGQPSGVADVTAVRAATPLPETADELCAVARDLGAAEGDTYLGARATESEVKALSDAGTLGAYRIVHFATHGALAGEMKGNVEPGLILTPPAAASGEDDGYLSASEVAGLKLDADWVILSACNTAAGSADGAEALSGLARAFFYAGARALLVSHWYVDSHATVTLITKAFATSAGDATVGRAEALRRSMVALIESDKSHEAHPAYWAPFVVVGEGAR